MSTFVKNITLKNIVLCDLHNVPLPPNVVVNLSQYATRSEIASSVDLAIFIKHGYVQQGTWKSNRFVITKYNQTSKKTNLSNLKQIKRTEI